MNEAAWLGIRARLEEETRRPGSFPSMHVFGITLCSQDQTQKSTKALLLHQATALWHQSFSCQCIMLVESGSGYLNCDNTRPTKSSKALSWMPCRLLTCKQHRQCMVLIMVAPQGTFIMPSWRDETLSQSHHAWQEVALDKCFETHRSVLHTSARPRLWAT